MAQRPGQGREDYREQRFSFQSTGRFPQCLSALTGVCRGVGGGIPGLLRAPRKSWQWWFRVYSPSEGQRQSVKDRPWGERSQQPAFPYQAWVLRDPLGVLKDYHERGAGLGRGIGMKRKRPLDCFTACGLEGACSTFPCSPG